MRETQNERDDRRDGYERLNANRIMIMLYNDIQNPYWDSQSRYLLGDPTKPYVEVASLADTLLPNQTRL